MLTRLLLPLVAAGLALSGAIVGRAYLSQGQGELEPHPRCEAPERVTFGNVEPGIIVKKTVLVRNIGKSDLVVRHFRVSCGCLRVISDDKQVKSTDTITIAPGRTIGLTLELKPLGEAGAPRIDTVYFQTNEIRVPERRIAVQCNLQGYLLPQPASIRQSELLQGQSVERTIDIANIGPPIAVNIRRVTTDRPDVIEIVETKHDSSVLIGDGSKSSVASIRLRLSAPKSVGWTEARVKFFADDSDTPHAVVPVSIQSVPHVSVAPSPIVLPRVVKESMDYSSRCVIRRADGRPFKIEVLECPESILIEVTDKAAIVQSAKVRADPGTTGAFRIRFRTICPESILEGDLTVYVQDAAP